MPTPSHAPVWPLRWLTASAGRDSRPRGARRGLTTSFEGSDRRRTSSSTRRRQREHTLLTSPNSSLRRLRVPPPVSLATQIWSRNINVWWALSCTVVRPLDLTSHMPSISIVARSLARLPSSSPSFAYRRGLSRTSSPTDFAVRVSRGWLCG